MSRERKQTVVLGGGEQLGEPVNGGFAHVGRVPGVIYALRVHVPRRFQLVQNDAAILLDLMNGRDRQLTRISVSNSVVAHHVGIEVMVSAIEENFRHGVARKKPDARVFKSARLVHSLQQRSNVVAQSETVTVEQL